MKERIRSWIAAHHTVQKIAATLVYFLILFLLSRLGVHCILRQTVGIPCPGCGMTRACFAALTLHPIRALTLHPMVWSVPVAYLYFLTDGHLFGKTADRVILYGIAAGFLVSWIVKIVLLFL